MYLSSFKKLGLLLTVLLFTSAGLADAQHDKLTDRVLKLSNRTNKRLKAEAHLLTKSELREIRNNLKNVRNVLNGGGGDVINPPPVDPGISVSLRGDIEGYDFAIQVNSLETLSNQCASFVASKGLTRADEINFSIDFGPIKNLYNSGSYWVGAAQICGQVLNEVKKQTNLPVSEYYRYVVTGKIETHEYLFQGQNRNDIAEQCLDFYGSTGLSRADEVYVSVNFNPMVKQYNSGSYWTSALTVCEQVYSLVN